MATRIVEKDQLRAEARGRSTPAQAEMVERCENAGWTVEQVWGTRLRVAVFIRHGKTGVAAALLPCGKMRRAPAGKRQVRVTAADLQQ